ncbi:MAG: hypothetical protein IT178_00920 [Acidobacteria bacterium]|nr:hypothetical protein [Acidobacteriota bacterium]
MFAHYLRWSFVALTFVATTAACDRPAAPAEVWDAVPQQMGTWQGRDNYTIGITSQSGKFRIRWQARAIPGAGTGHFRLTVHSAVSGRPLDQVVDHVGPGDGAVNYEEDPRQFNLMVDSADLDWSVTVDELVLVRKR